MCRLLLFWFEPRGPTCLTPSLLLVACHRRASKIHTRLRFAAEIELLRTVATAATRNYVYKFGTPARSTAKGMGRMFIKGDPASQHVSAETRPHVTRDRRTVGNAAT